MACAGTAQAESKLLRVRSRGFCILLGRYSTPPANSERSSIILARAGFSRFSTAIANNTIRCVLARIGLCANDESVKDLVVPGLVAGIEQAPKEPQRTHEAGD